MAKAPRPGDQGVGKVENWSKTLVFWSVKSPKSCPISYSFPWISWVSWLNQSRNTLLMIFIWRVSWRNSQDTTGARARGPGFGRSKIWEELPQDADRDKVRRGAGIWYLYLWNGSWSHQLGMLGLFGIDDLEVGHFGYCSSEFLWVPPMGSGRTSKHFGGSVDSLWSTSVCSVKMCKVCWSLRVLCLDKKTPQQWMVQIRPYDLSKPLSRSLGGLNTVDFSLRWKRNTGTTSAAGLFSSVGSELMVRGVLSWLNGRWILCGPPRLVNGLTSGVGVSGLSA